MKTVHFIGAGPGDPELMTIKGKRLIEEADIIILCRFAGQVRRCWQERSRGAEIYNSAEMTLPEVIAVMEGRRGKGSAGGAGAHGRSGCVRRSSGADGKAGGAWHCV